MERTTSNEDIIGGHQSPKALLDKALKATREEDISTLKEIRRDFMSVPQNIIKCVDEAGNTLAHLAIHKDPAVLRYVVEEFKAPVDCLNNNGKTPLHEAVKNDFPEATKYLLQKGASPNTMSSTYSTPFHTAASCGSVDCLEVLVSPVAIGSDGSKADKINEVDRNGCTALHKCAFDGGFRVAEWLVRNGANVNAKDKHDVTPLHVATMLGRVELCELLILNKADVNLKEQKQGNTALHYASSRCLPTIVKLLLAHGAHVMEPNKDDNTALHMCAMNARPEDEDWKTLVAELIRAGEKPLLEYMNLAPKKAEEYVSRPTKVLFTLDYVRKRDEIEADRHKQMEIKRRTQDETEVQLLAQKKAEFEEKARRQKEEQERLAKEIEERIRAEEEARIRHEEMLEEKRKEEEEAKKSKKGGKEKKEKKK